MFKFSLTRQWQRLGRRFNGEAPRVVVRGRHSWLWYALLLVIVACISGLGSWWLAHPQGASDVRKELAALREEAISRQEELVRLRSQVGTEHSALAIERATQKQLLERIAALEQENSALKEEAHFFERLLNSAAEEASVRVETFRLLREDATGYRYRLLLTFRSARTLPEFRGRLQILVTYRSNGGDHVMEVFLPADSGGERVEMKHFARREGVFRIPEGAVLVSAEARLFQGGMVRASQQAQL